jgi:OTU domain-containing protein 4
MFEKLLLERRGLKVVEEIKDGNCLFRCVARHIYSDPELFQIVRFECVEFMHANEAQFREFVFSDFGKYLDMMGKNRTWGGEIEVSALAQLYGLRIEVYQDHSLLPFLVFGSADAEILRVFYVNRTHYDSILPDIRASIQQE